MVHYLVKIIFLLFPIMPYNIYGLGKKNEVHVLNQLSGKSPQLELHCASGDNDLGYHYPHVGLNFHWKFDSWARTLFFCHFWWGDKDKAFDVFNHPLYCVEDAYQFIPEDTLKCIYKVTAEGFYLGYEKDGETIYEKYREW
ncbi:hypothetical protein P3L10_034193 [Capsicum annuum]